MRIFAFIFSFVLLGMSFFPCSDKTAFTQVHATSASMPDNDHGSHLDVCTPFCSCSCCGVMQVRPNTVSYDLRLPKPTSPQAGAFLSAAPITVALPIWQPPQLFS